MPGNAQIAIIKDTSKCIKKTAADKIFRSHQSCLCYDSILQNVTAISITDY